MKELIDFSVGIYLRPMTREDTGLIVAWRNSEEVRRNFVYQEPFTPEGHENWFKNMIETGKAVQMIICELVGDTPLGSVYIRDIDLLRREAEYGIFIGVGSARGRGVGTAAAKLMLDYCFHERKLRRVYLRVFTTNEQAVRSYEKAGFIKEGLLQEGVCINGQHRDMYWMAAINPDQEDEKDEVR